MEDFMNSLTRENCAKTGEEQEEGSKKSLGPVYSLQDALKIIQVQQNTINKLSKEVSPRLWTPSPSVDSG